MDTDWENLPPAANLPDSLSPVRSPYAHCTPPRHRLSNRFIPSRTAVARLDFSILDRELVTAEVSRNASEKEDFNQFNPGYNLLLQSELLGTSTTGQIPADRAQQLEQLKASCSPSKKLFRYKSGNAESPLGGPPPPSPYSVSPVGADADIASSPFAPPYTAHRKIPQQPHKVLDAPALQDNFYLNLVDWSSQEVLAVGLGPWVYLYSTSTSKVSKLCTLAHGDMVSSVAWSKRGPSLSVGSKSGKVQIWDASKMQLVHTLDGHRKCVGTMAWGSHVLSTGSDDQTILQRDVRAPSPYIAKLQGHRSRICGLKWSPDDRQLASGGNDNLLLVWQPGSDSPMHRFTDHQAAVKAIAWSPHQHGLLASGGGTNDRCIRFWNTASGSPINAIDTGSQVANLAWSRHSNELVSAHGYSKNQIDVWKYPSMAKLATLTGHINRVLYMAVSPDGQDIVTGAGDETLRFWNVFPTQRAPRPLGLDPSGVSTMPRTTIR